MTEYLVKEVARKTVKKPFGEVQIVYDYTAHEYRYVVKEPVLSKVELRMLNLLKSAIGQKIEYKLEYSDPNRAQQYLKNICEKYFKEKSINIEKTAFDRIFYYILKEFVGYDKIDILMADDDIEDISCESARSPVFLYHRKYEAMETNVKFSSDAELDSFVVKLAQKCGRQISIANPLIDTTFPDGSRVQLTFGREITPRGSSFSIRKFRKDPYTPPDLIELNTLSAEMAAYLWLAVEHRKSIIFCGGAGCGKTTTMNAISLFIPPPVKIVSIEEVREINIPHKNWIASVTRSRLGGTQVSTELEIDMFDLLKSSLRQRPQYIILGEIRGVEAFTLFQAMATGTTTFSTIHADSVDSIVRRLTAPPINLPSVLFLSLNLVVLQTQTKILGKTVRLIKNIEEIAGIDDETKQVIVNDVYSYSGSTKNFEYSGKSLILDSICAHSNISGYELNEELKRRTEVIELLCKKKIRSYVDAGRIIASYYKSPEDTVAYLRRV